MKTLLRPLLICSALVVSACITINIYFPAEELRGAADKIVEEVWGDPAAPPSSSNRKGFLLHLLSPATAHASQDINVSTPEIRAAKDAMKARAELLFPYLNSGHIGIGNNSFLKVRTTEDLNLRTRGEVNRLVNEENADRQRLYNEIARANGFPERAAEVQSIFADSWRDNARSGWFIEQPDGSWVAK